MNILNLKQRVVKAGITLGLFFAAVAVDAQDTHPFAGFTVIKIGLEPRMMAALEGKTEIRTGRETPESILIIVMTGNQGYASYLDLGSTHGCIAWMADKADASGSVVFGLGNARYQRRGVRLCSEFSLRKLSADRVLLDVNGLARELPIVGHYPVSATNWDVPAVKRFTLHGRGLGAVSSATIGAGAREGRKFFGNMKSVNLDVDGDGVPGYADFVRAKYDAAPAEPGGASYFLWASYDGQYRQPQIPTRSAFESGLFGKFGQPSIISDEVRKVLYLWAHDVSGNLIADADEARNRCLLGREVTPRTVVSIFRAGIGPSNCGIMLTVTADFADGVNKVRETVAHTYRMELFHGRALARRRAAIQMHDIQELRAEIEAKIDANKKATPVF